MKYTISHYKNGDEKNPQRFSNLTFDTFEEAVAELKRYKQENETRYDDPIDEKNGEYSTDIDNYFVTEVEED